MSTHREIVLFVSFLFIFLHLLLGKFSGCMLGSAGVFWDQRYVWLLCFTLFPIIFCLEDNGNSHKNTLFPLILLYIIQYWRKECYAPHCSIATMLLKGKTVLSAFFVSFLTILNSNSHLSFLLLFQINSLGGSKHISTIWQAYHLPLLNGKCFMAKHCHGHWPEFFNIIRIYISGNNYWDLALSEPWLKVSKCQFFCNKIETKLI